MRFRMSSSPTSRQPSALSAADGESVSRQSDPESAKRDAVVRALTDDGGFRVICIDLTQTVAEVVRRQALTGGVAQTLGELIVGAALVRETMSPNERVQLLLRQGEQGARLVAESQPDGAGRGLALVPETRPQGSTWFFEAQRTLPSGHMHRGVIDLARPNIAEALVGYMLRSEQVASAVDVACEIDPTSGTVLRAGGYLVQLLPELSETTLAIMTARLGEFPRVGTFWPGAAERSAPGELVLEGAYGPQGVPGRMLEELLFGMPFTVTEHGSLHWDCSCSEARMLLSLSALPRADLHELFRDTGALTLTCDYCRTDYTVHRGMLDGLQQPS